MTEKFDQISLMEVIDIFNEVSSMKKSLQDKEKAAEDENNDWWNKKED